MILTTNLLASAAVMAALSPFNQGMSLLKKGDYARASVTLDAAAQKAEAAPLPDLVEQARLWSAEALVLAGGKSLAPGRNALKAAYLAATTDDSRKSVFALWQANGFVPEELAPERTSAEELGRWVTLIGSGNIAQSMELFASPMRDTLRMVEQASEGKLFDPETGGMLTMMLGGAAKSEGKVDWSTGRSELTVEIGSATVSMHTRLGPKGWQFCEISSLSPRFVEKAGEFIMGQNSEPETDISIAPDAEDENSGEEALP